MNNKFLKVISAALMLAATAMTNVANAGLIHSYDYNGNANDGTGTSHGTVNGATLTTDRFGNTNSAYAFSGEQYIDSSFTTPTTASFSIWASLGSQTDAGDMLFSIDGYGTAGVNLWLYTNSTAYWNTWDGAANPFGTYGNSVRDGDFHHYVVVNDQVNNETTLYIDGSKLGTADYRHDGGNLFRVGAGKYDRGYAWDGTIDDVSVYDHALSQAEVSALYSATDVPEPSTLAIFALGMMGLASRRFKKQS